VKSSSDYLRGIYFPTPWYETWLARITAAALVAMFLGWAIPACHRYIETGIRVRDAMPPHVVVRHDHYTTVDVHNCGSNCTYSTTEQHYRFFDAEGNDCSVDERTWARVQDGQSFKCMNLYGWD
jgi:hypothetical protein